MALKNSTILAKAWQDGSNDFIQRIPNPSIAGYNATVAALFDPFNNQALNEFANMLVGLMGTYVESKLFENPLRELKKPAAQFGNTERHVAVNYLKAHSPKVDDQTLLKLEKPEFRDWFYSVNQHRRYEFSWNRYEMERVFSNGDGYAFDDLLSAILTQQMSSDNYDEMNTMLQAFAVADNSEGYNLYRNNITAEPTTKELGQELLVKIKTDAGLMKFPNTRYNNLDIPVHENSESLILWVTPQVDANLDVYTLAELFNVARAEVNYRKIVIPEFPIPNVYAALTSEDFIYCRDVWYGVEPPFYNPANRSYKYYLYHDQMVGVNPCANCVLYTTDASSTIPTIKMVISDLEFTETSGTVEIGGTLDIAKHLQLVGTVEPANTPIKVEPQGATYEVAGVRGEKPLQLNSRTYVDNAGILHLQKTGLLAGDELTITAHSVYTNPSGVTTPYMAEFTATVTEPKVEGAKESFVEKNSQITYSENPNSVYNG